MKRSVDWFVVALIAALAALVLVTSFSLGRSSLGFLFGAAHAGELTATWEKPETNCDGSPLTDLVGFRAYWGAARAAIADPAIATYTVRGLPPGDWWLAMTAYNADGLESPIAGPVVKTVPANEFTVSESTAYYIQKRTDRFVLMRVGDVPIGTPCIADQSINGHYAVPRARVQWAGTIRSDVVVAKCQ